MKRILVFFIVFIASMIISSMLLGSNNSDALFIKLLISGLIASVAFWFITVRDEQENTDDF